MSDGCERYGAPLPQGASLRGSDGTSVLLPIGDWVAPANAEERAVLAEVEGPAIDLGCGPGRVVQALEEMGIEAMGVDTSSAALAIARRRGLVVLERSVFAPLPAAGRWRTALLLDGNVGIGGDPVALFDRAASLLARDGRVLVEVERPGIATRTIDVRVESPDDVGPWFPWTVLGADALPGMVVRSGLRVQRLWPSGSRWFAWLERHDVTRLVVAGS